MSEPTFSNFLGHGQPTECRVLAPDIAVHWYPSGAVPGDPCFCGGLHMKPVESENPISKVHDDE